MSSQKRRPAKDRTALSVLLDPLILTKTHPLMPSLGSRHPVSDHRIVMFNGPRRYIGLKILPAVTDGDGHLFEDIDAALQFAMVISEVTGWTIVDLVDTPKGKANGSR